MKKALFISIILLIAFNVSAEEEEKKLYKWTDKQGNIHYSDQPEKGAEEIEMKLAPATKMLPPNYNIPLNQNKSSTTNETGLYDELGFVSPTNDGVIRNNANTVDLEASVKPQLEAGHSIRFFVDGNLVAAESGSTTAIATEIELGSHSANFIIVDAQGKIIQSSETVHFQLLNRINPKIRSQQQQNNQN